MLTGAERQQKFRERAIKMGRVRIIRWVLPEERDFLDRSLKKFRENGGKDAHEPDESVPRNSEEPSNSVEIEQPIERITADSQFDEDIDFKFWTTQNEVAVDAFPAGFIIFQDNSNPKEQESNLRIVKIPGFGSIPVLYALARALYCFYEENKLFVDEEFSTVKHNVVQDLLVLLGSAILNKSSRLRSLDNDSKYRWFGAIDHKFEAEKISIKEMNRKYGHRGYPFLIISDNFEVQFYFVSFNRRWDRKFLSANFKAPDRQFEACIGEKYPCIPQLTNLFKLTSGQELIKPIGFKYRIEFSEKKTIRNLSQPRNS